MAVAGHLGIAVAEYDERIRTFVPFYEEMLDVAAEQLAALATRAPVIVELGTGSGALAGRVLARRPDARVLGVDEDPAMLALASARLEPHASRVELRRVSFARFTLPRCDAVVASLALHHIRSTRSKLAFYQRIANALERGGLLVSADCVLPTSPVLAERAMARWRSHLRSTYSAREAGGYLRAWAKEDRYLPLDVELSLLRRAGLVADVAWRRDAFAVLIGQRA
jgi:trans-aconitate methyltransferase